jgi:hypothetical protein
MPRLALALAAASLCGSSLAADPPLPKKPLDAARLTGPGTQTEDDVYVGKKRTVQGVNTPGTVLQVRPRAGTSPNTGRQVGRSGGDDDLDDLEVERRKVQGVNAPGTTTPLPRPSAGTSPNTGRQDATLRPAGPLATLPK